MISHFLRKFICTWNNWNLRESQTKCKKGKRFFFDTDLVYWTSSVLSASGEERDLFSIAFLIFFLLFELWCLSRSLDGWVSGAMFSLSLAIITRTRGKINDPISIGSTTKKFPIYQTSNYENLCLSYHRETISHKNFPLTDFHNIFLFFALYLKVISICHDSSHFPSILLCDLFSGIGRIFLSFPMGFPWLFELSSFLAVFVKFNASFLVQFSFKVSWN